MHVAANRCLKVRSVEIERETLPQNMNLSNTRLYLPSNDVMNIDEMCLDGQAEVAYLVQ